MTRIKRINLPVLTIPELVTELSGKLEQLRSQERSRP